MTRVLVVDDDFMVARVHRGFVERVPGFEVIGTVHTGAEALDVARTQQPDLLLLDLYLPDLFGLDVLARLRAERLPCDVIIISAAKELDAVRGAVRQGISDYILKPFTQQALQQRLERYAAHVAALQRVVVTGQQDVDQALNVSLTPSSATIHLPKGLSTETAAMVERTLRAAAEPISATDGATATGLSRVSARRYLEHFSETGLAAVTLRYGAAGRPERMYRWTG